MNNEKNYIVICEDGGDVSEPLTKSRAIEVAMDWAADMETTCHICKIIGEANVVPSPKATITYRNTSED